MNGCDLGALVGIIILMLGFAVFPHAVDAQAKEKPALLTMYTMGDSCAQCKQVKNRIAKFGGKSLVSTQTEWPTYPDPATGKLQPVPYFPFCYYSDGTWGDGKKFLDGYARLPEQPVRVYYYHTREGN